MAAISIDGFPFEPTIQADVPPDLNEWSNWVPVKIEVMDFFMNPATVEWNGQKTWVADYELFKMLIRDWMERYGWSKAQALDEFFSMV